MPIIAIGSLKFLEMVCFVEEIFSGEVPEPAKYWAKASIFG